MNLNKPKKHESLDTRPVPEINYMENFEDTSEIISYQSNTIYQSWDNQNNEYKMISNFSDCINNNNNKNIFCKKKLEKWNYILYVIFTVRPFLCKEMLSDIFHTIILEYLVEDYVKIFYQIIKKELEILSLKENQYYNNEKYKNIDNIKYDNFIVKNNIKIQKLYKFNNIDKYLVFLSFDKYDIKKLWSDVKVSNIWLIIENSKIINIIENFRKCVCVSNNVEKLENFILLNFKTLLKINNKFLYDGETLEICKNKNKVIDVIQTYISHINNS